MSSDVIQRLENTQAQPGTITPSQLREDGSTEVNSTGQRSRIASLTLDTPHQVEEGRLNPFRVSVPAYEQFSSDGTGGNTETFNLSHSILATPNVESAVVYIDGTRYGQPDDIDYVADTIDVTDAGSNSNVHVWYISDETATIEVYKATPSAESSASERLYSENLNLVHQTKQAEQPEFFEFSEGGLQPFISSDMKLNVYVKAPYEVRFEDSAGDGATPDNFLLNVPVQRGKEVVPGLKGLIKQEMSSR